MSGEAFHELALVSLRNEIAELERYIESIESLGQGWSGYAEPYRKRLKRLQDEAEQTRQRLLTARRGP